MKINSKHIYFLAALIILFLLQLYLNQGRILIPLIGDEWYYCHPTSFKNILDWPYYSFGHPPLYNVLTLFYYFFFPSSPQGLHVLSFAISFILIFIFMLYFYRKKSILLGFTGALLIINNGYFFHNASEAYPLQLGGVFILLLVFGLKDKKSNKLITSWAVLSFLTRESLLSSIPGIMTLKGKKSLKVIIPVLVTVVLTYSYYYFVKNEMMINSQVGHLLENEKSFLNFQLSSIINYYKHFILKSNVTALFVIGLLLIPKIFRSKYTLSILLMALAHSLFFAVYDSYSERNFFYPSIYVIAAITLLLLDEKKNSRKLVNIVCIVLLLFSGINIKKNLRVNTELTNKKQFEVTSTKEIVKIIKENNIKKVLSSFDYNTKLLHKHMGYHNIQGLQLNDIQDYDKDSIIKDYKTLIIDDSKIFHTDTSPILKNYMKEKYRLYKVIKDKDLSIELYIIKGFELNERQ